MAVETSQDIEIPAELQEAYVVDTDFHAGPSTDVEVLLPYIDDERIKQKLRVTSKVSFPSRVVPAYATNETGGYHAHGAALDGESVLDVMTKFGINMPIITPGTNTLPGLQYPKMKDAICKAANDFALDQITPADDDIKTHVALPIWNPEACVEELDRLGRRMCSCNRLTKTRPQTSQYGDTRISLLPKNSPHIGCIPVPSIHSPAV